MAYSDTIPVRDRVPASERDGVAISPREVDAEAFRRIDAAYPPQVRDYLLIQGHYLTFKRIEGGTWNAADVTLSNQVKALRTTMIAIKDAAAVLKAMSPIPLDYQNNSHWPV